VGWRRGAAVEGGWLAGPKSCCQGRGQDDRQGAGWSDRQLQHETGDANCFKHLGRRLEKLELSRQLKAQKAGQVIEDVERMGNLRGGEHGLST